MTDHTQVLSAEDLSVRRGEQLAVEQVSFRLARETDTALVGPNGAGKSRSRSCQDHLQCAVEHPGLLKPPGALLNRLKASTQRPCRRRARRGGGPAAFARGSAPV
jgi:ABC-type lipopolysaccharide export system ATPase subunit